MGRVLGLGWILGLALFGCGPTATTPPTTRDQAPTDELLFAGHSRLEWSSRLKAGSWTERYRALEDIADLGDEARPLLPDLIAVAENDGDSRVRSRALRALGRIGRESGASVPVLLRALENNSLSVREEAVRSLGRLSTPPLEVHEALIGRVAMASSGKELSVGLLAAEALGRMGPGAACGVPALLTLLKTEEPASRRTALLALGRIRAEPQRVIPAVRDSLREAPFDLAPLAAQTLMVYGAQARLAAPDLLDRFRKGKASDGGAYLAALRRIDPSVLVSYANELRDGLRTHRGAQLLDTVDRLAVLGPDASPAILDLGGLLANPNAFVRQQTARALGDLGAHAEPAVGALGQRLTDPHPGVRFEVSVALGLIGPPATGLVNQLQKGLEDSEPRVQLGSAFGLASLGSLRARALQRLRNGLGDRSEVLRGESAELLGRLGEVAHETVPDLTARLRDDVGQVREAAARALEHLAPASITALPALVDRLQDRIPSVRLAAAIALGQLGASAREALPALRAARTEAWERYLDHAGDAPTQAISRGQLLGLFDTLGMVIERVEGDA